MIKIILTLCIALCLVSCSSCGSPSNPIAPDGSFNPSEGEVISGDTWKFILPSSGWQANPMGDGGTTINVYTNGTVKNLIAFAKEPFTGSIQQYMLLATRGLKDSGGTLDNLSQLLFINNTNFVSMEATTSSGRKIWSWLSVKNGYGYSFVCSGIDSNDESQHHLCEQIAQTIQLN